jgi:hypothetical protein
MTVTYKDHQANESHIHTLAYKIFNIFAAAKAIAPLAKSQYFLEEHDDVGNDNAKLRFRTTWQDNFDDIHLEIPHDFLDHFDEVKIKDFAEACTAHADKIKADYAAEQAVKHEAADRAKLAALQKQYPA